MNYLELSYFILNNGKIIYYLATEIKIIKILLISK